MLAVGLTGGIGAGKSTVSRRLAERGATVIDADLIAREVVAVGTPGLRQVQARFGEAVVDSDGALDRPALGAIVFGDDQARADLNAIVHPLIGAETVRRFAGAAPDEIVVHDMPLLVELGQERDYHLTIVVGASEQVRLERLARDRGMSEQEARARMAAQADDEQRRAAADVWLDNSGDQDRLSALVDRLWDGRLRPYESNLRTGSGVRRAGPGRLVDPDPTRPATGARLAARIDHQLRERLPDDLVSVEHIGSTAVAGLPAKDVIDLQVQVRSDESAHAGAFAAGMSAAGFVPVGDAQDDVHPWAPDPRDWQKVFFVGADPGRVSHVHVRRAGSAGARTALTFRDALRDDAELRARYHRAKQDAVHQQDTASSLAGAGYEQAKRPFFADHLAAGPGGSAGAGQPQG